MKKTLLIIIITSIVVIFVGGIIASLFLGENKEKKLEACKKQCQEDIPLGRKESESGRLDSIDYSDRNACIQMCIEKYK